MQSAAFAGSDRHRAGDIISRTVSRAVVDAVVKPQPPAVEFGVGKTTAVGGS